MTLFKVAYEKRRLNLEFQKLVVKLYTVVSAQNKCPLSFLSNTKDFTQAEDLMENN